MREIETKILNVDIVGMYPKLQSYVEERSGRKDQLLCEFIGVIEASYYVQGDVIARVRKKESGTDGKVTAELTIKNPTGIFHKGLKEMFEENLEVENFEKAIRILGLMGYKYVRTICKHRTSYTYENIRFEFDVIAGCPPWLEIESPLESDLHDVLKYLGYTLEDTCSKSQVELYDEYKGEKG